ncbi:unnamed protein product [Dracunculus medinensis]|uniref:ShKT domain-containing protein n=1 Tax=Dracunculus medinensis TaxID=318479 RepID=A0A3P7PJ72_DRAME|nr:unnamed protein product [Dracunculus medinensis]
MNFFIIKIKSVSCTDAHVDCPSYRQLCNFGDYGICRRTCVLSNDKRFSPELSICPSKKSE